MSFESLAYVFHIQKVNNRRRKSLPNLHPRVMSGLSDTAQATIENTRPVLNETLFNSSPRLQIAKNQQQMLPQSAMTKCQACRRAVDLHCLLDALV